MELLVLSTLKWRMQEVNQSFRDHGMKSMQTAQSSPDPFGLARMHDHHGKVANTTRVLGTVGYIAPEVVRTGTTSTMSLALEYWYWK